MILGTGKRHAHRRGNAPNASNFVHLASEKPTAVRRANGNAAAHELDRFILNGVEKRLQQWEQRHQAGKATLADAPLTSAQSSQDSTIDPTETELAGKEPTGTPGRSNREKVGDAAFSADREATALQPENPTETSSQTRRESPRLLSDPAPSYGSRQARNGMIALLSVLVAWYGVPGLWQALARQVAPALMNRLPDGDTLRQTIPGAGAAMRHLGTYGPAGGASAESLQAMAKSVIGPVAQAGGALRAVPGSGRAAWLYHQALRIQLLRLAAKAVQSGVWPSLAPKAIYQPLHGRGITGAGFRVGLIDNGLAPTRALPADKIRFFKLSNLAKPTSPQEGRDSHGTAVANLIAAGAPGADFVMVQQDYSPHDEQLTARLHALIQEARRDPDAMTWKKLQATLQPAVQGMADSLKKAVDEGASVVNISMGLGQNLRWMAIQEILQDWQGLDPASMLGSAAMAMLNMDEDNPDPLSRDVELVKKLYHLKQSYPGDERIGKTWKMMLAPWNEALDYAQRKNVLVVLASGNLGGHTARHPKTVGHVEPLAAFPHPALMTVASTREDGTVSQFSSEYSDSVAPNIAANGSGELSTNVGQGQRGWWRMLLNPVGGLQRKHSEELPVGTSLAAPDLTTLYVMAQSARKKLGKAPLTPLQFRTLVAEAAHPAQFSRKMQAVAEKEGLDKASKEWFHALGLANIGDRSPKTLDILTRPAEEAIETHVDGALKRRVGPHGTIAGRRRAVIALAEQMP